MSDRDEKNWIRLNEPWKLEKLVEPEETEEPVETEEWYFKLTKIKGIGIETAKDIGVIFNSLSELRSALLEDKVALRNDVVIKLKQELL